MDARRAVKLEILRSFPTQGDFADALGQHESRVSQVVRGRRKLSRVEGKKWIRILKCDPQVLEPVIGEK
jgi:hypothetical protein